MGKKTKIKYVVPFVAQDNDMSSTQSGNVEPRHGPVRVNDPLDPHRQDASERETMWELDVRELAKRRLAELRWSAFRLVHELQKREVRMTNGTNTIISKACIYQFLAGKSSLNSDYLGAVLEACGLSVTVVRQPE